MGEAESLVAFHATDHDDSAAYHIEENAGGLPPLKNITAECV